MNHTHVDKRSVKGVNKIYSINSIFKIFSSFNRSSASQLVTLHFDSKPISVFCHMGEFGCGDGGWTPVMKIDGNKVSH